MYTITLADGTQLEKLELNGNNYIAPSLIEDSVFEGNLSTVTITDGTTTETYEDMALIQNVDYGDGKSWFILAPKSPQEKEKEALEAEINGLRLEVAEMENILDSMLIEQLSEKGLILHE